MEDDPKTIQAVLDTIWDGKPIGAAFETAYQDLRRIAQALMRHEPPGHTIQATGLVNEAYMRLVGGRSVKWEDRRHFIRLVTRAMRQVLVDRARRVGAVKRGASRMRVDLGSIDAGLAHAFPTGLAEELDAAIDRLAQADQRTAEVVQFRFMLGLTVDQTAELMGVSPALVKKEWKFARTWLVTELNADHPPPSPA